MEEKENVRLITDEEQEELDELDLEERIQEQQDRLIERALSLLDNKQYAALRELLSEAEPADISEFFDELTEKQTLVIYRLLPKELAAEVFIELDPDQQEYLIRVLSESELKETLDELYYDDTADVIEEMPASVVKRILAAASPEQRRVINELLKYPEDSAGSIMTTEFVRLKKDFTVMESLEFIRKVGIDKARLYFSGENLFYWSPLKANTRYLDPESAYTRNSDSADAHDHISYPWQKTIMFGLDITF